MKKRLVSALLALLMMLPGAFAVDLYVDGSALQTDVEPILVSGRTLVPLRAIFEALDAAVAWDGASRTATAQKGSTTVRVAIDDTTAYVNGQAYTLDVPAQLIDNRTMVPARFVSESLDARVLWDGSSQTVYILTAAHDALVAEYLDVGQADSILLSSGGEYMLIDAGNNADGDDVVAYLRKAGAKSLKYVVGTHAHEDHIGGMDDVIDAFPVRTVLLPAATSNTQTYSDVLDAIERSGVPLAVPQRGDSYTLGNTQITVVAAQPADDLNNTSIVLRAVYGSTSFLFMGDAEAAAEADILRTGMAVDSDVLKVGHHGSDTSTTSAFLAAVSPQAAVISCGAGNSYGHPSPTTLERLSGIPVWRTDLNGTVIALTDGTAVRLTADKSAAPTPSGSAAPPAPDSGSGTDDAGAGIPAVVYITPTGKRYHYSASCAGKNATPSTLADALSSGLTPCQKCAA